MLWAIPAGTVAIGTFVGMFDRLRFSTIQTGLVLFWAVWLMLVTATNVFDAFKQLGALPSGFTFASHNFVLVKDAVGSQVGSAGIAAVLFAGAIAWELLASGLFWRAWLAMCRGRPGTSDEVTQAFAVSIALWAAFLIATEATVSYATAATHKGTMAVQLLSFIVVRDQRIGRGDDALRSTPSLQFGDSVNDVE